MSVTPRRHQLHGFPSRSRDCILERCLHRSRDAIVRYAWYESPIGRLLVARDDVAVRHVTIPDRDPSRPDSPRRGTSKPLEPEPDWVRDDTGLAREIAELEAYFAGDLREFEMAVEPEGTAFRRQRMGRARPHPLRGNLELRRARPPGGRANGRGPRRRRRQRRQPRRDRPPLPSGHRGQREPRGLRRGVEPQGAAACARAGRGNPCGNGILRPARGTAPALNRRAVRLQANAATTPTPVPSRGRVPDNAFHRKAEAPAPHPCAKRRDGPSASIAPPVAPARGTPAIATG